MLFITPSSNVTQAKDYYARQLSPSDYYSKDMPESPGRWHGLGAKLLGLEGDVKQKDFFALCENTDPNSGKNLTRNKQANRRVLYDFTFSVPKDVSLAYEITGNEQIRKAFESSVKQTMDDMEAQMMGRVRANGEDEDRYTSNMVYATFTHRTTRPIDGTPDPHLHQHVTVFNATFDAKEQKWKAAQFSNLVRDKGYYQAAFDSRLAGKLSTLGYGIEREGKTFGIIGISKELSEKFSRRTEEIEAKQPSLA